MRVSFIIGNEVLALLFLLSYKSHSVNVEVFEIGEHFYMLSLSEFEDEVIIKVA